MLPYTPLHHLLLARMQRPLVMSSGNRSDDPIAHRDEDAFSRLGPLVDGVLAHDRQIHIRCDDSVVRASGRRLQMVRRSRGYAPESLPLPGAGPPPGPRRRRRAQEHGLGGQGLVPRLQPPHRRSRAPRHLSGVPAGDGPPLPALRDRARGRRPRPAPGVPLHQARTRSRLRAVARAASPCPCHLLFGRART